MSAEPLLLYDGTCGFCSSMVQFVLRHDRRGTARFASLDSAVAKDIMARHPELTGVDSVVWVVHDTIAIRSDAVVGVARYLGGIWHLLRLARLFPRVTRDRAYDWVARHRHSLPGARSCVVPPPESRDRFLG